MRSRLRIRIRIEVKSWIRIQIRTTAKSLIRIRIRIKVMRIRNPGVKKGKKASCNYGYVYIAWLRNNKQVRHKMVRCQKIRGLPGEGLDSILAFSSEERNSKKCAAVPRCYSIASAMKARNRRAYCSGSTVDIPAHHRERLRPKGDRQSCQKVTKIIRLSLCVPGNRALGGTEVCESALFCDGSLSEWVCGRTATPTQPEHDFFSMTII